MNFGTKFWRFSSGIQWIRMLALIAATSLAISLCPGCESGDKESWFKESGDSISVTAYVEKAGDTFKYRTEMDIMYSNGETASPSYTEVNAYSRVDSIPARYGYWGDIKGPYVLNTKTENGVVSGYEYLSALGTDIVDDDLDTFTRIDATTESGSDEPDNVSIGDTFDYSAIATEFDSDTATEVGSTSMEGTFTVEVKETVSTQAGSFECLRIDFDMDMEIVLRGVTDTVSVSGSGWWDTENGYMIRIIGTMEMTLNEYGVTATASVETELLDYDVYGI